VRDGGGPPGTSRVMFHDAPMIRSKVYNFYLSWYRSRLFRQWVNGLCEFGLVSWENSDFCYKLSSVALNFG